MSIGIRTCPKRWSGGGTCAVRSQVRYAQCQVKCQLLQHDSTQSSGACSRQRCPQILACVDHIGRNYRPDPNVGSRGLHVAASPPPTQGTKFFPAINAHNEFGDVARNAHGDFDDVASHVHNNVEVVAHNRQVVQYNKQVEACNKQVEACNKQVEEEADNNNRRDRGYFPEWQLLFLWLLLPIYDVVWHLPKLKSLQTRNTRSL